MWEKLTNHRSPNGSVSTHNYMLNTGARSIIFPVKHFFGSQRLRVFY